MSTITKQIAAVEFQANAKQANAALQSIQNDAVKAREKVEDLQRQLKQAEVKNLGAEAVEELRINLREATKDMRTFETAQQSLMKGVKAFDELWKHAKAGTIERLTGQQIQAGVNAAKLQLNRLKADIPEDQAKRSAIFSMTDEARKVLARMKTDTDNIIQELERGGQVAKDVLEREQRSLKEMLSLVEPMTDEWAKYNTQLTRISKGLQEQELAERRLRGEITDRQQAIRMAGKEESAAVSDAIAAAKMRAEAAKQAKEEKMAEADAVRAEMNATQQSLEQVREEIRQKKEAARASAQATDAERTSSAELYKAKVGANKAAREEQDAYKKQKKAVTELGGEVDSLRQKYEELRKKQQDMSAATIKPEVDTSDLEKLNEEMDNLQKRLKEKQEWHTKNESWLQGNLDALKQLGLTEEDLADDAKVREATEKKVLELLEAQANVKKETAEQEKAAIANLKDTALGGTKADHEYYAKNKGNYSLEDYETPDDVMERIAHLEHLKKLKNGKRFDPYEDWTHDDELDEDAPVMNDKEREAVNNELRILKQHVREEILKAIREAGDIDKGVENATGGDGVSEDAKFGEEINDKIDALKDKIRESIKTSVEAYNDILDDEIDPDIPLSKEELTARLKNTIGSIREDIGRDRDEINASKEDVEEIEALIAAKQKEIETIKAGTQAQRQSADAGQEKAQTDENLTKVQKEMADAEEALRQKEQELAAGQQRLNEQSEKAINASQEARRATQEFQDAKEAEKTTTENATSAKSKEAEEITQLRKKEQELTDTLNEQTDELTRNTEEVNRLTREQIQSQQEADNLQNNSIEKKRQAIRLLEELNEQIADPGNEQWKENERAIGRLNEQLRQLKQESAELRGEVMSLADAELTANQAMAEQAMTTKTGWAAGVEELKQAETVLTDYLSKAKRGTAEEEAAYQRMVRQLQAIRTELGAGSISGAKMMEVLSDPTSYKNIDTLKGAIIRARNELNALGDRIDQAVADGNKAEVELLSETYDDLTEKVKTADKYTKELANSSKGVASSFEKAWSRVKTYISVYVSTAAAIQKLSGSMDDLLQLSDKMGEVRKTTGFTADEVGKLSDNLAKLDTRKPITQLMELSSLAGSVGLKNLQDVQGFTEAADKLIVALPEMGNESARTLIKIATATGDLKKNNNDVRETLEKVGSTIIALRANSASAAGPITDFVSRVGAVGAQSGISIDQMAALGSTIDALGGRVEMSATALSRMIPAIKNNSFAIANSIGVTEQYLKSLAPMEQMVLIFQRMRDSIQGIDTSTEAGQEQMAKSIEDMLGRNATMREVMKDLEQQGARAGIVFGLLSQNVDELQRQLGIAGEAYANNTALMDEYNNMNETAAAKWERLKNKVEEFFVSDKAQSALGNIIGFLRTIVDILTGNNGVVIILRSIIAYITIVRMQVASFTAGVLKQLWIGLKNIGIALGFIKGEMTAMQWGNVFTAAAAAVWLLIEQFRVLYKEIHKIEDIIGDVISKSSIEIDKATQKTNKFFESVGKARVAVEEANEEVKKAKLALEAAKKAMDDGSGSAKELEKAETDLKTAHEKVTVANNDHKNSIAQLNREYSPYLGYMLSEISTAKEVANARELINAKLRETILLKQKEAGYERIEGEFGKERDSRQKNLYDFINKVISDPKEAARVNRDITNLVVQARDGSKDNHDVLLELRKIVEESSASFEVTDYLDAEEYVMRLLKTERKIKDSQNRIDERVNAELKMARTGTKDINGNIKTKGSQQELKEQLNAIYYGDSGENNGLWTMKGMYDFVSKSEAKELAAKMLKQMDAYEQLIKNARNYYDLEEKDEQLSYNKLIEKSNKRLDGLRKMREKLIKQAGDAYKPLQDVSDNDSINGHNPATNPYGTYNRVTSPYKDWDADSLVSRRKEMLERVRALANGADVQAVLSEDAKFISEATRKNIKDTKQAIEWYNDERLKIQEALHERHLTNTGDWADPKKGAKKASKMVQDEMKYYLDELDAYYTERKAMIQEERNDEEISEGEAWRRTLLNEAEWQQRRAELQQLYANKSVGVTEEEQNAIYDILSERTGDTMSFIRKDIEKTVRFIEQVGEKKGKEAMDKIYGDLDLGIEKAFLRRSNAVGKQVQFITDTLAKERPFNGITENLQENLTKMGILTGQVPEKMHFLLGQIEDAYTLDVKEMTRRISEAGFKEWADEISGDTQVQQALLAQLRQAYEAVQENIRKEASRIKKDADMMWKLALLPDGTNLKQAADDALSMLALQQERVTKANQLIGAGPASDNVASRIAIKQLQLQLSMQQAQFALMRKMGKEKQDYLLQLAKQYEAEGQLEKAMRARTDAENVRKSVNIAITDETKKQEELNRQIANEQEEVQNRLYKDMKEYANLMYSGLQGVFEASNAGSANYYNEMAKMRLTGGGGGGGQYIVIDNAGTADAEAHYEMLSEQEALRRQMEIEQQNAMADALKKMMDEFNQKIAETITDQMNAMLQADATDMNTKATNTNTSALTALTDAINRIAQGGGNAPAADLSAGLSNTAEILAQSGNAGTAGAKESKKPSFEVGPLEHVGYGEEVPESIAAPQDNGGMPGLFDWNSQEEGPTWADVIQERMDLSQQATDDIIEQQQQQTKSQLENDKKQLVSTQSMYAKMTAAANLYGIAYQAMSNNNMTMAQKFGVIALQAVGNAAITALNVAMSQTTANTAADTPSVLSKAYAQLGPIGGPIAFGLFTGLLGGLMGLAAGAIGKGKSEIAQATGVSVGSGRMATGMLTYAEGNVNELTDPDTLTAGRSYNVDGADGKTYRARYMGKSPRTHITNGPEFHLVGEAGQEAIIDAKTTRQIRMDDNGIWRSIQTLYNGGRLSRIPGRRVGKGIPAFADGNIGDFQDYADYEEAGAAPFGAEQLAAFQTSLDRNNELLDRALTDGIRGVFSIYGKNGLIDSYDTGKRNINRYGQRF